MLYYCDISISAYCFGAPCMIPPQIERNQLVRRGLKLNQLRLMAALAETEQVGSAAAQLAITQPAASRMLADLERIVGTRLYERHARGINLTEAGQTLARNARRMLRQLDDTHADMIQIDQGLRGRVQIGTVTGPALDLVLPTLRQTRLRHPQIEMGIVVNSSDILAERLMAGALDFYLGRHVGNIDARAVSLHPIAPEALALIVRRGHPLITAAAGGGIGLMDCLEYDWVLPQSGGVMRSAFELYLMENGHSAPRRVVDTSSQMMTLAIIGETNAIAPLSLSAANFFGGSNLLSGGITALPIQLDLLVSTYSIVTRAGEPLSPAAKLVHGILLGLIENIQRPNITRPLPD